jgi:hypothetical protein
LIGIDPEIRDAGEVDGDMAKLARLLLEGGLKSQVVRGLQRTQDVIAADSANLAGEPVHGSLIGITPASIGSSTSGELGHGSTLAEHSAISHAADRRLDIPIEIQPYVRASLAADQAHKSRLDGRLTSSCQFNYCDALAI